MPQPLIAITGATGQIGGRVAERLSDQGANIKLIVRDAGKAPALPGAEITTASGYSATEEMTNALAGADVMLFVSAAEDPDRVATHQSVVEAAKAAGVERIVYTSFIGAAPDSVFTFARDHFATEEAIKAAGLGFTFLRDNLYLDVLPYWVSADGKIRGPAGDGRFYPVARDDVADCAVTALTDADLDGETLDVCGGERVSMRHIAWRMEALTGKKVEYEQESIEDAYRSREVYEAPPYMVEGWVSTYTSIASGELDVASDVVQRLTGREPLRLDDVLRQHPESYAHIETSA